MIPADTTIDADIARYADAVRAALRDLSPADREDVTKDLDGHLREVAHEGGIPLSARLGPPGEYAAELRSSAGLAPWAGSELGVAGSFTRLSRRAADDMARIAPVLRPALRPAWWLLRGVLAAAAIIAASAGPLVTAFGVVGVLVAFVLLAVLGVIGPVASVMLGRHTWLAKTPATRTLNALATTLTVLATAAVLPSMAHIMLSYI